MLSVYLVLLLGIPSDLTISGLASLGRPSFIWGLVLALWWVLAQLQRSSQPRVRLWQPVRFALLAFFVIVLVSFAAALFRGQPADQISPATTSVLRVVSWSGVLLVAMDGLSTRDEIIQLARRLIIGAGLIATLGVAQFATGQTLLGWVAGLPGVSFEAEMQSRGDLTRAAATASHPLEYAVIITGCLPLALLAAMTDGFRVQAERQVRLRWWLPAAMMTVSSLLAVSRSALIGLAVAVLITLPAMTPIYRRLTILGGLFAAFVVVVLVPGIATTMLELFVGADDDPSAQSRSNALARLSEFMQTSPWIGHGFGTFLPRYYIFDDDWALLAVEVGFLGVAAFAAIAVGAVFSATHSISFSGDPEMVTIGRGIAASMLTTAVLFAFFDGLSFPMAGGAYMLLAGLAGAVRGVSTVVREVNVGEVSSLAAISAKPCSETLVQ